MKQALIAAVAALGFLVLALWCMRSHAPAIEAQLQVDTEARLDTAGLVWAEVIADGRELTVRGLAPDQSERRQAVELVAAVPGVRRVDNQVQLPDEVFNPAATTVRYETRLTVDGNLARYTGFAPDTETRRRLMSKTRELFGARRVEDALTIRPDAPDNWEAAMSVLQSRLATYVTGDALISGNNLNVTGTIAPGREGERKLLASRLPANFRSEISLSIARTESAERCQQHLDELMRERINFEVASAVIRPDSTGLLAQLGERIRACGGLRIEVAGHTDSQGLAMKNLELSQQRAEAVARFLVGTGIDPDQLVPWGYGETRPIADNDTAAGRAKNRRIEFQALDGLGYEP